MTAITLLIIPNELARFMGHQVQRYRLSWMIVETRRYTQWRLSNYLGINHGYILCGHEKQALAVINLSYLNSLDRTSNHANKHLSANSSLTDGGQFDMRFITSPFLQLVKSRAERTLSRLTFPVLRSRNFYFRYLKKLLNVRIPDFSEKIAWL